MSWAPRRYVRIRNHSLAGDPYAIEIRLFVSADQIGPHLYQNLHLSVSHRNSAAIHSFTDAETGADIVDIRSTDFHLQLARSAAFGVKISIASQQFDLGRLAVADSDAAVGIQTDVNIRCGGNGQPFSRYSLVDSVAIGLAMNHDIKPRPRAVVAMEPCSRRLRHRMRAARAI